MISVFCDENAFLSNFYPTDIVWSKYRFKSAEHLYQAMKCADKKDAGRIINTATAKKAKILGRYIKSRDYWDTIKTQVMLKALRLKFSSRRLRTMLRETGEKQLINVNYWHDTFWGVCGCTKHQRSGLNMVGQILMKIRAENNKVIQKIEI